MITNNSKHEFLFAACEITSTDTAIKEIDHMRKMVQRLRDLEMERVELRAEELSLKSKNTNTEGDVVIDLDDFESVSSPQRKKDVCTLYTLPSTTPPHHPSPQAAVSSYIPEPFYDEVLFVSVSIHSGDVSAIQKRSSSEWCSANFVVLPDNSRPECVGALSQDDVKRYEKVQRLVCCMLAILTAIRLKRRRVPFLSHKWTSTLRSAYRQTGEKEDETKVMKSASFRKSADTPDSPKMKKASEAAPTRSIVLMNLCSKGDEILELFHSFTCAKRFVEMGTSATGMFTRHLQVEQAQMDREIASLILQLKVAQEMHQYRPMLFGVKKKGSEDKSIKEREQDALEKKKTIIETQKEERRSRIQSAAQHIADRNIHEEMARLAVVQQQYDDKKAKHDKVKAELRKWQNMSTEHLVQEINTETDQLRSTEKKVQALELGKKRLKSEIETSERGLADMHKQMKDNQRKALQELEAKQHAARDFIENRKKMARSRMDEMRAEIEYAGNLILEKAADLLSATQSRGHSAGTEAVDEAKLVQENLSASVKGLHQILPRILPSDVPSSEMQKRIATVRDKILANASHELLSLQSELSTAGIPLPIAASTHEAVRAGPLVSIHITVLGVSGLLKNRKNSKYSVAHQWRGGGVAETARVPLKDETGVVEFKHLFKVAHRLPAEKKEIGTAVALETFAVVEFLPDGSFSEALPFDIDLNAFACRAKQIYHIVPGAKSNVSVAIEVTTKKMKLREPQANPLHTVTSLHAVKITDDYGPSSDEGE